MPIFPFGLNDLLVCRLLLSLSFACCYFCCSVACILLLSDGEMNVCRIIHNMSPSAFRHAGVFAKSFFNFFFFVICCCFCCVVAVFLWSSFLFCHSFHGADINKLRCKSIDDTFYFPPRFGVCVRMLVSCMTFGGRCQVAVVEMNPNTRRRKRN